MLALEDRTLQCKDCRADFVFSAGEQAFYQQKGFENEPTRCKVCRETKKRERLTRSSSRPQPVDPSQPRVLFPATCSSCGMSAQVPFRPAPGKPVYCRDCYQMRTHGHSSSTRASL